MSSTRHAFAIPDQAIQLPEKPSLEFERKRAKQLLHAIHEGDLGPLVRVRRHVGDVSSHEVNLSHVHLTVAREYGFPSWPKLVQFFETLGRHEKAGPRLQSHRRHYYEMQVQQLIRAHAARRTYVTRGLAAFVPRLYSRTDAEIFSATLQEDDAKLVVARMQRFMSWNALAENADRASEQENHDRLQPLEPMPFMQGLASSSDGAKLSRALLIGPHVKTKDVAHLLERGADPNWLPPSGVPILEHALMNYWNPEAVDLIARRVTPRKGFWISAGLGDVAGMLKFLDVNGNPTEAARQNRPDFLLVGFNTPCRPDADNLEILWEAFAVAGFNQRLGAIDALLERGFPIDYAEWGSTLLQWAEGNRISVLRDHLLKRGARPSSG